MTRGITNNSRKKECENLVPIWTFSDGRLSRCSPIPVATMWSHQRRIRRVMKKRDWLSESRSSKKGLNCGSHLAKIASIDQSSSNLSSTKAKILALRIFPNHTVQNILPYHYSCIIGNVPSRRGENENLGYRFNTNSRFLSSKCRIYHASGDSSLMFDSRRDDKRNLPDFSQSCDFARMIRDRS